MKKKLVISSLIILILDQLIKYIVITKLVYDQTISIIPNFFYLTYVKNTGGAWSILSNNTTIFIIIGFLFIGFLIYYLVKKNEFSCLEKIYYVLLLGGIIGNFVDRIVYSGVVDYLGFIFGNYYFPVFNLADICIVAGAFLLVIDTIRGEKNGIRSK